MDFFIPILSTLAIGAVLILLMVALVSAPWQVLLLILVLGAAISQWLIRRNHLQGVLEDLEDSDALRSPTSDANPSNPQAVSFESSATHSAEHHKNHKDSFLFYRGASYKPSSSLWETDTTNIEITGKYRGGLWRSFIRAGETTFFRQ